SRSHIIKSNANEDDEPAAVNRDPNLKITKEEGSDSGISKKQMVNGVSVYEGRMLREVGIAKGNQLESIWV
ncbi:hypothetical protein PanWU01x14_370900, partial [Parasponia andersonii]